LFYGSLTLSLSDNDLWPRKEPKDIHYSASQLGVIIREIQNKILSYHSMGNGNYHTKCGRLDCSFIDFIFAHLGSPVLDSHIVHMKAQREEMNL
jgi:hypothetical protein